MDMTRRKLKLKVRPKLPAKIIGGAGVSVTSDGLVTTAELDFTELQPTNDLTNKLAAVYDPAQQAFFSAPLPMGKFASAIVTSVDDLKAVDTTNFTAATFMGSNRPAFWFWRTGDYSDQLAVDTVGGMFVKSNAIDGTAGCWVADVADGMVHSRWFDAVGDYDATANTGTDNTTALQMWLDVCKVADPLGYYTAFLDAGFYKITAPLKGRVYVSMTSHGERWAQIFPVMSSGVGLCFDGDLLGFEAGYHQTIEKIGISGDHATGTAQAFSVGGNTKLVTVRRMWFQNFTALDLSLAAVEHRGNGYGITWEKNHWLNNARHFKAYLITGRVSGVAEFPTNSIMKENIIEGATATSSSAMQFLNCSGYIIEGNIIQGNNSKYTILAQEDSNRATSSDMTICKNLFEGNGVGISGSIGILAEGSSGSVLMQYAHIYDNRFHGTDPANKLWIENTNFTRINNNTGGDGIGYGIRKNGTNTNYSASADGLAGTID